MTKTTSVYFSTREYQMNHGAMPRGFGSWAFVAADKARGDYLPHVKWFNISLEYTNIMQNILLGYSDRIRERIHEHTTLGEAVTAYLRTSPDCALVQLHRAADDLMRIIELEQAQRADPSPLLGEGGSRMICCGEIR